jgi:hypothetical protein
VVRVDVLERVLECRVLKGVVLRVEEHGCNSSILQALEQRFRYRYLCGGCSVTEILHLKPKLV